jgi:hypothetical protein
MRERLYTSGKGALLRTPRLDPAALACNLRAR